jgi:hypothetical protein
MGVRHHGAWHSPPGIDIKIALRAVKSRIGGAEELSHFVSKDKFRTFANRAFLIQLTHLLANGIPASLFCVFPAWARYGRSGSSVRTCYAFLIERQYSCPEKIVLEII